MLECDDHNPCTRDWCSSASSGNIFQGDHCSHMPKCNDGNSCTADTCDTDGTCSFSVLVGETCTDGRGCTFNDTCQANGDCLGSYPVGCADDNPCTHDYPAENRLGTCTCDHSPRAYGSCADPRYPESSSYDKPMWVCVNGNCVNPTCGQGPSFTTIKP